MIADSRFGSTYHYPRCVRASGPGGPRCRRASFCLCFNPFLSWVVTYSTMCHSVELTKKNGRPSVVTVSASGLRGHVQPPLDRCKPGPVFGDFPACLTLFVSGITEGSLFALLAALLRFGDLLGATLLLFLARKATRDLAAGPPPFLPPVSGGSCCTGPTIGARG